MFRFVLFGIILYSIGFAVLFYGNAEQFLEWLALAGTSLLCGIGLGNALGEHHLKTQREQL